MAELELTWDEGLAVGVEILAMVIACHGLVRVLLPATMLVLLRQDVVPIWLSGIVLSRIGSLILICRVPLEHVVVAIVTTHWSCLLKTGRTRHVRPHATILVAAHCHLRLLQ